MLSIFSIPLLALSAVSARNLASRASSPVKGAWYAGWHSTEGAPLASVAWDKYNTLYYAFAVPTDTGSLSMDGSNGDLLPQFVSEAHAHKVEAHIAIGGWDGSGYFSSNLGSVENRTKFVQTVADFVGKYKLDGVQFDWEYPNRQGVGCNGINKDDSANLMEFLAELRKNPSMEHLTISAAVSLATFNDVNGNPTKDVAGFAEVLDYVALMNYDVWGSWSTSVGPNAPLNDTCASTANQQGSAVSAVQTWANAGMPHSKIVLGVASYGHSFSVSNNDAFLSGSNMLAAYPAFDAKKQPMGDKWDNTGGIDVCGVYEAQGGTFRLWGLVDGGFLTKAGLPANGIYYRYDNCSQTPYVYNQTSQVMISFDNAQSFAAKGEYIKNAGLRGFSMWEAAGDSNNILLDSITKAIGS